MEIILAFEIVFSLVFGFLMGIIFQETPEFKPYSTGEKVLISFFIWIFIKILIVLVYLIIHLLKIF